MKKKKKIKILSSSFKFPNVRSFLYPFILFDRYLIKNNIHCQINPIKNKTYDLIFIESNFFGREWAVNSERVLESIYKLKKNCGKIIYFDLSDSTTLLHPKALDLVDLYCKGQILKNKNLYKNRFYGRRIYTDYCHRKFGIVDSKPVYSESVTNTKHLEKIELSWNSSLSNYSLLGKFLNEIYQKLPIKYLLTFPRKKEINNEKKKDIMSRMNLNYERNTISWHRKTAIDSIRNEVNYQKITTFNYFRELKNSKITISPFGWGEINYRDYEAFIYGSILLKPNMSHINTWPNYYEDEKTTIFFDWSCNDINQKIENILNNYENYEQIAKNAKKRYFNYINKNNLKKMILNILKKIIN